MSLKLSALSLKTAQQRAKGRGVIAAPFELTSDEAGHVAWLATRADHGISGALRA